MKNIILIIKARIKYLKECELYHFNKSLLTSNPKYLRTFDKNMSNEFQTRRNELESLLNIFNIITEDDNNKEILNLFIEDVQKN
jgi:hypothetical protein